MGVVKRHGREGVSGAKGASQSGVLCDMVQFEDLLAVRASCSEGRPVFLEVSNALPDGGCSQREGMQVEVGMSERMTRWDNKESWSIGFQVGDVALVFSDNVWSAVSGVCHKQAFRGR